MRMINRTIVLDAIRRHAPVSRADLVRFTSISAPTVSSIVEALVEEGAIEETGQGPTGAGTGRRPMLLVLSPNAVHMGADLSTSGIVRVGLLDGADKLGHVAELEYPGGDPAPEAVAQMLADRVADVKRSNPALRILGVGVGAPGVTDSATGFVHWAPALTWRDVPFAQLLGERIGLPVSVDNDVNLALVGEVNQGAALEARHALLVAFREGVGGAVLVDGSLYRGRGAAGEVGYLVTGPVDPGADLRPFGFTETRISNLLAEQCTRRGIGHGDPGGHAENLARLLTGEDGELRLDDDVREAVVESVAAAVACATALLDPEAIVLSGWIEALGDGLVDEVRQRVQRLTPVPAAIRLSALGSTSVVVGAALSARRASTTSAAIV
jgi:glucokinase